MDFSKIKYINYRCRKCGQLISEKISEDSAYSRINYSRGVIITIDQKHPNCIIDPTEKVLCDLISISDESIVPEEFIVYKSKMINEEQV